jgi:uncharacterized membrane protein
MSTCIDGSIQIEAPAALAYEHWNRMEEFPRFIDAIESVTRIDERRSVWRVNFGFQRQEWTAEITEVIPNKRRAWRTLEGPRSAGMVNFHEMADALTLMTLHLDYDPRGVIQNLGDELGVVGRVIDRALGEFKEFVEACA